LTTLELGLAQRHAESDERNLRGLRATELTRRRGRWRSCWHCRWCGGRHSRGGGRRR
jgi:hypothetical protein